MRRDFIFVVGLQGYGKSVWTKAYSQAKRRLFVSDPTASFPGVDYQWEPEILDAILRGEVQDFRLGTYDAEELPLFGHAAFAAANCAFVIEESALMFKRGADLDGWAKRLVYMGRHAQVDLILVAQRAMAIPLAIRSQATRVITFAQTEPDDVDAVCERIGGDHYDEIRSLPPLECLDWEQGTGVRRYPVTP